MELLEGNGGRVPRGYEGGVPRLYNLTHCMGKDRGPSLTPKKGSRTANLQSTSPHRPDGFNLFPLYIVKR